MILHPERLEGVHPDLVAIVEAAAPAMPWDILVVEGIRTVERQRELVAHGASQTMHSRHIPGDDGLGKAVDLAPAPDGQPSWAWPLYYVIATQMKAAATNLGTPVEWGGDWTSFKDGPHWQLPHATYP